MVLKVSTGSLKSNWLFFLELYSYQSNTDIRLVEHRASEDNCTPAKCDFTQTIKKYFLRVQQFNCFLFILVICDFIISEWTFFVQVCLNFHPSNVETSECYSTPQKVDSSPSREYNILSEVRITTTILTFLFFCYGKLDFACKSLILC